MSRNLPARIGMRVEDVDTPCLLVDLDAFERNIDTLAHFVAERGLRLRAHAKTHKSADIAAIQVARGGACGICCQKVSEAEALVAAGVTDVLVSNEVVAPVKIDRLAALAKQARVMVCVDDLGTVAELSKAALRHGVNLGCLVEIDVGAGRCGCAPGEPALAIAKAIDAAEGLTFEGLQAYHGPAQHVRDYAERKALIASVVATTAETIALLKDNGLTCATVAGAGTGSFRLEGTSGVYNELQCGSYVFMDADYGRIRQEDGRFIDTFENSLFLYTAIVSKTKPHKAVCDAGHKSTSADSGPPVVFGRDDITYLHASDEHGELADPGNVLRLNDKLKLIPGHCDPTVNLHDWLVGVRNGNVETLWPVTARGTVL